MRTLTKDDIRTLPVGQRYRLLFYHVRGFNVMTDFSGNVFADKKIVILPFDLCIPELRQIKDNLEIKVEK